MLTPTGAFRAWAAVALVIVSFGLGLGITIAYVTKVDRDSERRNVQRQQENVQRSREICGLIVLIDDRNQSMPPVADPATMAFRAETHRYRLSLGC